VQEPLTDRRDADDPCRADSDGRPERDTECVAELGDGWPGHKSDSVGRKAAYTAAKRNSGIRPTVIALTNEPAPARSADSASRGRDDGDEQAADPQVAKHVPQGGGRSAVGPAGGHQTRDLLLHGVEESEAERVDEGEGE